MAQIRNLKDTATDATIYPVTTPQAVYGLDTLLTQKVDKIPGKGLSTNDYDNASKTKLDNLPNRDTLNASLGAKQNTLQPSSDITPDPRTNQLSLTRSAKMALFIDQWNTACGTYGRYDPDNAPDPEHPFYLNTLWLTYKEALEVIRVSQNGFLQNTENAYRYLSETATCRTLLPIDINNNQNVSATVIFQNGWVLETLSFVRPVNLAAAASMFNGCSRLREILGELKCTAQNANLGNNMFANCKALQEVRIYSEYASINVSKSPLLSFESIKNMVDKKTSNAAITITVHPDVYAKLIGDTTNAVAAALTPEELAQWQQILTAAAEKQITFATV